MLLSSIYKSCIQKFPVDSSLQKLFSKSKFILHKTIEFQFKLLMQNTFQMQHKELWIVELGINDWQMPYT